MQWIREPGEAIDYWGKGDGQKRGDEQDAEEILELSDQGIH